MTNEDENVNPMLGANSAIATMLSQRYGKQLLEGLHQKLSNSEFKRELDSIRKLFGIKVSKNMDVRDVDQYIVDCVYKTTSKNKLIGNVQDIGIFMECTDIFDKAITNLVNKYGVKPNLRYSMKLYVVKGSVTAPESTHNMISVQLNKVNGELIVRINSESRNSSDLKLVTSTIYKSWDAIRNKPSAWSPSKNSKRDAEIARYYELNGETKTLDKYMESGFEAEAIMRAVGRIKRKAK